MTDQFEDLVYLRDQKVEGIGPWIWPKEDNGAWLGPSEEFAPMRDAIRKLARKYDTILTAGGCCGMYPRLWSETFAEVYTAEPAPLNWFCLQKNCTDGRIHKYNAAVGDVEGPIWLQIAHYSNVGCNTIKQAPDGISIEVKQITIDSLNLPDCDVIQLDIESYEPAALLGAAETILKYKPVVCLETKNRSDQSHILLEGWGYKVGHDLRNDTIFVPI